MLYLLVLFAFLILCMLLSYRTFGRFAKNEMDSRSTIRAVASTIAPAMLLGIPITVEVARTAQFLNGIPITPDSPISFAWLTLIGGAWGLGLFGWRAWQQRLSNPSFMAVGANVLGLAFSSYMAFVAIDQFMFFAKPDSGMLSWGVLSELSNEHVKDVNCAQPVIVVRGVDSDTATFRCPGPLVIGPYSARPFVPWPDYTEGESKQLAVAIKTLPSTADKH